MLGQLQSTVARRVRRGTRAPQNREMIKGQEKLARRRVQKEARIGKVSRQNGQKIEERIQKYLKNTVLT